MMAALTVGQILATPSVLTTCDGIADRGGPGTAARTVAADIARSVPLLSHLPSLNKEVQVSLGVFGACTAGTLPPQCML